MSTDPDHALSDPPLAQPGLADPGLAPPELLAGKTLLIVDDNPANLRLVAAYVDGLGMRVIVAQNAEIGLHRARLSKPDLILLDVLMPGLDGIGACALIRQDPELTHIPVIFMSALCDVTDKVAGLAAGAVDYITKPVQRGDLLARIRVHLELAGLRRTLALRNQALLQAQGELEQRVHLRTAELASANRALVAEVEARRNAEARARHAALYDALTDLPNRTRMRDAVAQAIRHADGCSGSVAFLLIDLDTFRNVNDSLGHQMGDALLAAVATRLSATLAERALLGRVGGDEFGVCYPCRPLAPGHEALARELRDCLVPAFELQGYALYLDVCIGISLFPTSGQDADGLFRSADTALYHAKGMGRGNIAVYQPSMDERLQRNLQLSALLRDSLAAQRFRLDYQPVVCFQSGRVVGAEALLRWRGSPAPAEPAEFIAIAEDVGLIGELGRWVMHTAVQELARWHREGHGRLRMAVNVSVAQVHSPGFVDGVRQVLQDNRVPPGSLVLEITEGLLLSPDDRNLRVLNELHLMGIRLAVDDFGTGYSSLSYLRHFPVEVLKVDRSFVAGMTASAAAQALPAAIVAMAHGLGMVVVAEGVETVEQESALRLLGCEMAQGYRYSRAVSGDEVLRLADGPSLLQQAGT